MNKRWQEDEKEDTMKWREVKIETIWHKEMVGQINGLGHKNKEKKRKIRRNLQSLFIFY